jgi:hypothetical protein
MAWHAMHRNWLQLAAVAAVSIALMTVTVMLNLQRSRLVSQVRKFNETFERWLYDRMRAGR